MPEIIDVIAYVKWLNKEFGYSLTAPEFLSEDSPWNEEWLEWHKAYANAFNDPQIRQAARKWLDTFRRRGDFAAVIELANEPEQETE